MMATIGYIGEAGIIIFLVWAFWFTFWGEHHEGNDRWR